MPRIPSSPRSRAASNPNGASSSFRAAEPSGPAPDTIAAIATPPGRGAIAIVRVSGPDARAIGRAVFGGRRLRPRVAERGPIVAAGDGALLDDGLALFFPAPNSYTGEDVLELHVHGSPAVARETLLSTLAAGARLGEPGEFTRRAFEAGKLDLTAAEAVADLIATEHAAGVRAAAARLTGGLAAEVERIRCALAALLEALAAALDFPDEVVAPERCALAAEVGMLDAALAALAETWERGRLVREGVAIALVGPPNAGKSSLLNALLGVDRALVSEIAGTTRDTVEEQVALGGGAVGRLIDTAGLRDPADALEAAGIARTEAALAQATLALVVVDGAEPLGREGRAIVRRTRGRPRVVAFTKADRGRAGYDEREGPEAEAWFGSTREPADVERVRAALAAAAGGETLDLSRPHLGTARQAAAVLAARRALGAALATFAAGDPIDLAAPELALATATLGALTGRDASEAVVAGIFARFCVGK